MILVKHFGILSFQAALAASAILLVAYTSDAPVSVVLGKSSLFVDFWIALACYVMLSFWKDSLLRTATLFLGIGVLLQATSLKPFGIVSKATLLHEAWNGMSWMVGGIVGVLIVSSIGRRTDRTESETDETKLNPQEVID